MHAISPSAPAPAPPLHAYHSCPVTIFVAKELFRSLKSLRISNSGYVSSCFASLLRAASVMTAAFKVAADPPGTPEH